MLDIKIRFVNAIERTGDPLAPIKLNDAFVHVQQIGKLFASIGDRAKTEAMTNKLLSSFPDEMDDIACDPNFLCSLCALLTEGLVRYGATLSKP